MEEEFCRMHMICYDYYAAAAAAEKIPQPSIIQSFSN
jgi:hypothetical protein